MTKRLLSSAMDNMFLINPTKPGTIEKVLIDYVPGRRLELVSGIRLIAHLQNLAEYHQNRCVTQTELLMKVILAISQVYNFASIDSQTIRRLVT